MRRLPYVQRRWASSGRTISAEDALRKVGPHTVLVDAAPFIFTAHYGMKTTLTRKDGVIVTGLFGFTRTLLKLRRALESAPPVYVGLFLDCRETLHRNAVYEQYKANRPKLPQDLIAQLNMMGEACHACGLATVAMPGFEADDLIATYASLAAAQNHQVTIVTPDKDMMQLVGPNVICYDLSKRVLHDEEAVRQRWGVEPHQVAFVQALCGDKVDNIPGAKGIGPVIAARLVKQYGDLEGIRSHLKELSPMQQKMILSSAEQIDVSLKLARLDTNVAVPPLEQLRFEPKMDSEALYKFLRKNEFYSILNTFLGPKYVAPADALDMRSAREKVASFWLSFCSPSTSTHHRCATSRG
jgi:DNA polymerase-1